MNPKITLYEDVNQYIVVLTDKVQGRNGIIEKSYVYYFKYSVSAYAFIDRLVEGLRFAGFKVKIS